MNNSARSQEFLAQLADIKQDLPYSLTLLRDLFTMAAEDSRASMDDVAEAISQDQGLTTKILALANSAYYGLQAKVSSVARACALLGLKEIRNLVLVLGAQSVTVRHTLPEAFNLQLYWKHQLCVALLAQELARLRPRLDPDILFTAGLLHDFGTLLTALHRPDDWRAIMSHADVRSLQVNKAEHDYWGIDHGVVGAITLDSWRLPRELTEPVNWHHAPQRGGEFKESAAVLCIADALHHRLLEPGAPLQSPAGRVMEVWGWTPEKRLSEAAEHLQDDAIDAFATALH